MKSLKELYRIGKGPSSSHTIGPERACKIFLAENPGAESFKAVLYGSLAKTGVGHGTDGVVKSVRKSAVFARKERCGCPIMFSYAKARR